MKIIDGKLILEVVTCSVCEGSGEKTNYKLCPRIHKKCFRDKCPDCGAHKKYNHNTLGEYKVKCFHCEGGKRMEEINDLADNSILQIIKDKIKIYRNITQETIDSLKHRLLDSTVFSVTDYGRAGKTEDAELIRQITEDRGFSSIYLSNFCYKLNGEYIIPDHFGLFVGYNEYKLWGVK